MKAYNRFLVAIIENANHEIITIRDFRMSFSISKVPSSDPNTCSFTIYNLSRDTSNKINKDKATLTVKAGYGSENNTDVIFVGDIHLVNIKHQIQDILTVIDARDGHDTLLTTRDSISFKEGVSVKQILKSIIKKFKIAIKKDLNLTNFTNKTYSNGFCFMGELRGLLDKIAKDSGLTWSVQNNELKFYNDSGYDDSMVLIVNESTGLIGSPEKIKKKKTDKTTEKEIDGWNITTLLQPKAEAGGIIYASSIEMGNDKKLRIESVQHNGDNFEGDFITTMEAVDIG